MSEFRLFDGASAYERVSAGLRAFPSWPERTHIVDTTMLFAPKSGGVKRYLLAKREWMLGQAGEFRHTLVVPGRRTRAAGEGLVKIAAPPLPFTDGYRCPTNLGKWVKILKATSPDLIEAGDPYVPGHAALDAGDELGVPVVAFCHTDAVALAQLQLGDWAVAPTLKAWSEFCRRFDRIIAPSRYIQARLADYGIDRVTVQHLGVDIDLFTPERGNRRQLLRRLELPHDTRLLMFAGRPSREKNIDALVETVERLGDPYRLLLIGAGRDIEPSDRVIALDYVRNSQELAGMMASVDAFIHANENEPFGLVVLEALAAGTPVVGPCTGGIGELIDTGVGQCARSGRAEHLAEAVEALFERDQFWLRRAARARALARHSWDRTFQGLAGVYRELLGTDALVARSVLAN